MRRSSAILTLLFGFWFFPWWGLGFHGHSSSSNQDANVDANSTTAVFSSITATSGNHIVVTQH